MPAPHLLRSSIRHLALVLVLGLLLPLAPASAQSSSSETAVGPVRLRQPQAAGVDRNTTDRNNDERRPGDAVPAPNRTTASRSAPSEFERYVGQLNGEGTVRRLGAELVVEAPSVLAGTAGGADAAEPSPVVPADYVIGTGDEVLLTLWGGVDADLRLTVDRGGRLQIPRVGAVMVAGLRYQDLPAAIERQARKVFKQFELAVSLGQVRSLRVLVTGFVERPGNYSVSGLATVSGVLMKAGGPAAAGSFRDVELRRGGKTIARLDLYDLLVKGRRDADEVLQAGDVVHVGPVTKQVAVIGSVNRPAVIDLKPGETFADALAMAGGFATVAERRQVTVEGIQVGNRVTQVDWATGAQAIPQAGDVVRVLNATSVVQPIDRNFKRVRVEGEVNKPGEYVLPPGSTVHDLLKMAGGYTGRAFIYGADYTRESVRRQQQASYERALRDLEVDLARRASNTSVRSADEQAAAANQVAANERLLARMRELRPTGRLVLQLPVDGGQLPELPLEDGDRITVPTRPDTVGVFGSVFNTGSFLWAKGRTVEDYLQLAGSPTKGADRDGIFVIRANGTVISAQQDRRWFSGSNIGSQAIQPGDTIFVPEESNKTTLTQGAKDVTQILYQFGVGLAAILNFIK